jgi:hypothetical protein
VKDILRRQILGVPAWVPIVALLIRLAVIVVGLAAVLTIGVRPGSLTGNGGPS